MLGDGLQAKVYSARWQEKAGEGAESAGNFVQCVKVFQPQRTMSQICNSENEFTVSQKLVGHPNVI